MNLDDDQLRAAAKALLESNTPRGHPGAPQLPGPTDARSSTRRARRILAVAAVVALLAASAGALVWWRHPEDSPPLDVITPVPHTVQPGPGTAGAVLMLLEPDDSSPVGWGRSERAALIDTSTGTTVREIDLQETAWNGGDGGTRVEDAVVIDGRLFTVFRSTTDVVGVQSNGASTDGDYIGASARAWAEGGTWPNYVSERLALSPSGTSVSVRTDPTSSEPVNPELTVSIPVGSTGGANRQWKPPTPPSADQRILVSPSGDQAAVIDGTVGDHGAATLHLADVSPDCDRCVTAESIPLPEGFGYGGYLSEDSLWLIDWATGAPPSLKTLDLRDDSTTDLPSGPFSDSSLADSSGDGNLLVYDRQALALWQLASGGWAQIALPPPPDGYRYSKALALGSMPEPPTGPWCDLPTYHSEPLQWPGLGPVVITATGEERTVAEIDGLAEVLERFGVMSEAPLDELPVTLDLCAILMRTESWPVTLRFGLQPDGTAALEGVTNDPLDRGLSVNAAGPDIQLGARSCIDDPNPQWCGTEAEVRYGEAEDSSGLVTDGDLSLHFDRPMDVEGTVVLRTRQTSGPDVSIRTAVLSPGNMTAS